MDRISQVKCISAYQNDYLWPDVSKTRLRAQPSTAIIRFSPCNDSRGDEFLDRIVDDRSFEWSRVVPVTQRLEPKLCSTKIRPEVEPARYEQPRKCVKKIEIECPDLHKILEKLLPEDKCLDKKTTARVEADRWKTTYQVDFSDPAARMAKRIAERDKLCRIDDAIYSQQLEQRVPIKIIVESDCSSKCCLSSRYNGNSLQVYKKIGRKNGKKCTDEKKRMQLPAWKSEYQDSISKIGHSIVKAKLHHKRSAAPMLAVSY